MASMRARSKGLTSPRRADLHGEALELFESWRGLGWSETQALEEVRLSGIVDQQGLAEIGESMGMTPERARRFAVGRGRPAPAPAHPFDALVAEFQRLGMSEAGARAAAVGRSGSEGAARRELAEAAVVPARPEARRGLAESAGDDDLKATLDRIGVELAEVQRALGLPGPAGSGRGRVAPLAEAAPRAAWEARANELMRGGLNFSDAWRRARSEGH
jgi:hypothetical protein